VFARLALAALALPWCALPWCALSAAAPAATAGLSVGEPVPKVVLPRLGGGESALLGADTPVSVFVFCKPGQEHSHDLLKELNRLRASLPADSVHWTAVVSDRFPVAEIEELRAATECDAPVLLTKADSLFGAWDIALLPVVGVADGEHVLRALVPYRKVNYVAAIEAHVDHLLGRISTEELERVLAPPAVALGGEHQEACRFLKLAERLWAKGSAEAALGQLRQCLAKDSTVVAAHVLAGEIRLSQGEVEAAADAFERALALEPENEAARVGLDSCRE
jgi:hypothetical protein